MTSLSERRLAALVATAVESPLGLMLVSLVLGGLAVWAYMKRPYWMYALFLTPGRRAVS